MSKARLSHLHKQVSEQTKTETKQNKTKHKTSKATQEGTSVDANIPRGERGNFLKLTITMSPEMLVALKNVSIKRKSEGMKDCDTSALIREAVSEWIKKQ